VGKSDGGDAPVDGPVSAALERNFDVGGEGAVGVADASQVGPRRRTGIGRGRSALAGDEVAESARREPGDVADAERISMLYLDVDARRCQDVVGHEREVVAVARADRRHDVAVCRQPDRAARRRDVNHVGRGRVRRPRRHEYDRRGDSVVRDHHRPGLSVDQCNIRQPTTLTVTLKPSSAITPHDTPTPVVQPLFVCLFVCLSVNIITSNVVWIIYSIGQ